LVATSAIEFAAALSKDGKIIATYFQSVVRNDKLQKPAEIRLHEVDTGKELPPLSMKALNVSALAFSPDGQHLVSLDYGGLTRVWDWAHGKLVRDFANPNKGDTPLAAPKGGISLAIARDSISTEEKNFALSPDGSTIMFMGRNNTLHFVDVRTGKEIGPGGNNSAMTSVQFTPDGKQIVTRAADDSVDHWDASTGRKVAAFSQTVPKKLKANPKGVTRNIAKSPDGKILAGFVMAPALGGPNLFLFNASSLDEIARISLEIATPVVDGPYATISPDNELVAVFSIAPLRAKKLKNDIKKESKDETKIDIYEVATRKRIRSFSVPVKDQDAITRRVISTPVLVFSPDGQALAFGVDDETLLVWDVNCGKRIGTVTMPGGVTPEVVAFSPDGRCLALDMNDGTALLYELAVAAPRRSFGEASRKAALKIPNAFPLKGPNAVMRLPDPGAHLALSPDGRLLALAGADRIAHVWDINSGREVAALKGHVGPLTAVAFSPDSKLVASASADTTALIWDLSKLNRAALAAKKLKPAELEQYWQTLALADGVKAFAAICDLTASPAEAVAWIKDKVKPAVTVDAKTIESLIAQLDDNQFKVRDKAAKDLNNIGEQTVPALEKALEGNLTLETKRRIEELRDRLTSRVLQSDRLRNYRAVEVLERIGTPEAREVLQALANGAPGVLLTTSAQAALGRVSK
jgi:WD40 repeat protein